MKDIKSEIKKFYRFLKNNDTLLAKLSDKVALFKNDSLCKEVVYTAKENGFNFTCEDLKNYEKQMQIKAELSNKQLLEASGGISNKKIIAKSLLSLITITGASTMTQNSAYTYRASSNSYVAPVSAESADTQIQVSLVSYLKEAEISKAQERAFQITDELFLKTLSNVAKLDKISSYRYNKKALRTDLEKQLDLAVENGDLPIKEFTLEQINSEATFNKSEENALEPEFEIIKGIDALKLSEFAENCSIVQVASQFNALEAMSLEPTEAKSWIYDNTQGPRASLQSVAAVKHRESAHLQNKLPDALQEMLEKCILKDGTKILEKYTKLYKNGYLQLLEVKSLEDLAILKDFLSSNIGEFKFLSQWVKCEGTGKKQLQVFSAAPSFQGSFIDWNKTDTKITLLKEICEILVVNEYKSIAQVAAIRSKQTTEPISLHLTLVGQGAFKNPPEIIKKSVEKVKEELRNTNVKVYLHSWSEKDCQKW